MLLNDLRSFKWRQYDPRQDPYAKTANSIDANAWREPRLSLSAQASFLNLCWNHHSSSISLATDLKQFESYFFQYQRSCLHLPAAMHNFSHKDICETVQYIAANIGLSRDTINQTLSLSQQSTAAAPECIDFVGRAVLLLDLTKWQGSESFSEYIERELAYESTQKDQFRLPTSFNARSFERIAGVRIVWSHNLFSHLKVGSNMDMLTIFHHAKVLDLYESGPFQGVFPNTFIEETRQSLALMIPKGNKASKVWFKRHQEKLLLDPAAGSCPYLGEDKRDIQRFKFWRDRLIVAKEMYDEGQPGNILQVWRDDRNKVQWWTFWIAFFVFWFTLASAIEGALQVYKAYYPTPVG